ncbi:MAG TPA: sigma-54 dependent transcriptional regulator [Candidatus Deferrimicrobium sp.]|nr:sigma-54 dependent transcriptional regulator [Candidatus Deferrimicrobium sp.]
MVKVKENHNSDSIINDNIKIIADAFNDIFPILNKITAEFTIVATKSGCADYMLKPFAAQNTMGTSAQVSRDNESSVYDGHTVEPASTDHLLNPGVFKNIITRDEKMVKIFHFVEKFAVTDNSVLIWGESGTGKELIARAIHEISARKNHKFVAVNAGAFANELFTSEFFGHAKGSFTGALTDKKGFIEEAQGGTLFLDEIGELSLPIQVKLLRVLQENEFYRLGSTRNIKTDVRIIAATNKNLFDEIKRGNFRKDLFFRLNINSINLPPLRERYEDIPLLAEHFLKEYSARYRRQVEKISSPVLKLLKGYSYPGNVRELMNLINSAVIVETGVELQKKSLPEYFLENAYTLMEMPLEPLNSLQDMEKEYIKKVLDNTRNNKTHAAKILGISRVNLIAKIKKYDLD